MGQGKQFRDLFKEKIDAIFCINLDRRSDRWEIFKELWTPFGVPVERFSAIDGSKIKTPETEFRNNDPWHSKYSRACNLSHILVMERAIAYGYKEILIVEDDALPCSDFVERFVTAYEQLPSDYDFCYLGASFGSDEQINMLEHISENIARAKEAKSTVAYLIKLDFAQRMMPWIKEYTKDWVIDEIYRYFQIGEKMYIFDPRLIHQMMSYSDILRKDVNYSHMRDLD